MTTTQPPPSATKGEADRVASELLGRVVGGVYPPGLRLPAETELASELGCGRSTVREALTRLSTLGVVASRRGSGARVLDWRREGTPALLPLYVPHAAASGEGPVFVAELLEMRRLLAREAVRLAVRYASDAALAGVRKVFDASLGETDPVAHVLLELEVFRGLVVSSEVWPAVWFANSFWGPIRDLHSLYAPLAGGPPPDYAQAMKRLLDLVEARKQDAAIAHVDRYLGRVDQMLIGKISGADATPTVRSKKPRSTSRRRS